MKTPWRALLLGLRFPDLPGSLRLLRNRRVAFVSSRFGTPRHTCEHGREQLAMWGVGSTVLRVEELALPGDLQPFDLVILNRVPLSPPLEQALRGVKSRGGVVVGDMDDMLLDPEVVLSHPYYRERPAEERARLVELVEGLRRTFALCSHVLCYTSALAAELERFGFRPLRVTSCASQEMQACARRARNLARPQPGAVTVGFAAGHPGHAANLAMVVGVLEGLLEELPGCRLVLLGGVEPPPALQRFGARVELRPHVDWRELPREICRFDVAVAPLAPCAFNEGKSHLKYVEAALCRVPLVASPVGQLGETIRDGVNGRLAGTPEDWASCLRELAGAPELRHRLGARAHAHVLRRLTTRACAPVLVRALGRAVRETIS
ncbi:MAG TPA: glycosyltransferase family 4 protein [Thermoanaerobaculaceae bacterium]|nr:glycosyltransferase family 4 protein [Thermoanaerobaculaceae bacterium]HRS15207.1 glycosyltransferase family 4 protein [Thermoanaerobaculaceae bacterium]